MLTIKKDHRAIKAMTAGCIAFAVGLTGAAAYMNSAFEHQNLVFNKEQSLKKTDPATKTENTNASTTPASDDATNGSGGSSPAPTVSGVGIAPAPSSAPAPSPAMSPSTSAPVIGGMGGGTSSPGNTAGGGSTDDATTLLPTVTIPPLPPVPSPCELLCSGH